MRQDVFTSWIDGGQRNWLASLAIGLLTFATGCQLTKPPEASLLPTGRQRDTASSLKPQSATKQAAVVPAYSMHGMSAETGSKGIENQSPAAARIRGQSPQWSIPSPDDAVATVSANRYLPPSSSNPTTSGFVGQTVIGGGSQTSQPEKPGSTPSAKSNAQLASSASSIVAPQPGAIPANGPVGSYYDTGNLGYGPTSGFSGSPSDYSSAVAPGAMQDPNSFDSAIAPGVMPGSDSSGLVYPDIMAPSGVGYRPRQRISPIDVYVQEARTGRIILGGSVNSDLGVAGQLVIDERNFDIRRVPTSWRELWSGRAFRGGGQNFRAEFMPGSQVQRYTVNWTENNLFGYLPYSLSVGGFYYTRQFRDWTEQRLGGRMALGYAVTKDLSISSELRMEDVNISSPRVAGVDELDSVLGSNDIYTARFRVARDTRDNPFMSTEGSFLEIVFDQVFGEYDFSRGNLNYSRYFNVHERPDGGGRHILASTWKFGVTGSQTPIFENYFAGGYSTLRGFSFRGASPKVGDVQVGGEMMFLGSLEYVFPLTADEMLRGVAFVDYGTVEQDLKIDSENFRVSPGLGFRIAVPALGPAPLAFDFSYPINHAPTDDRQVFSFFMGLTK